MIDFHAGITGVTGFAVLFLILEVGAIGGFGHEAGDGGLACATGAIEDIGVSEAV